jgi:hypothetical protein
VKTAAAAVALVLTSAPAPAEPTSASFMDSSRLQRHSLPLDYLPLVSIGDAVFANAGGAIWSQAPAHRFLATHGNEGLTWLDAFYASGVSDIPLGQE